MACYFLSGVISTVACRHLTNFSRISSFYTLWIRAMFCISGAIRFIYSDIKIQFTKKKLNCYFVRIFVRWFTMSFKVNYYNGSAFILQKLLYISLMNSNMTDICSWSNLRKKGKRSIISTRATNRGYMCMKQRLRSNKFVDLSDNANPT